MMKTNRTDRLGKRRPCEEKTAGGIAPACLDCKRNRYGVAVKFTDVLLGPTVTDWLAGEKTVPDL